MLLIVVYNNFRYIYSYEYIKILVVIAMYINSVFFQLNLISIQILYMQSLFINQFFFLVLYI